MFPIAQNFLGVAFLVLSISSANAITSHHDGSLTDGELIFSSKPFAIYTKNYWDSRKFLFNPKSLNQIENKPSIEANVELVNEGEIPATGYMATFLYEFHNTSVQVVDICGVSVDQAQRLKFPDAKFTITPFNVANSAFLSQSYQISESGVYGVVAQLCSTNSDNPPLVNAKVSFTPVQAFGYLSAPGLFSILFNKWGAFVCAVAALSWLHCMMKWYNELLSHHWLLFLTISLCAVASFLNFLHMSDMNSHSEPNIYLWLISSIATVVSTEYARIMVMFAAVGWGISRPHLLKKHVIVIGTIVSLHTIVGSVNAFVDLESVLHRSTSKFNLGIKFALAVLDGSVFWYVFENLAAEMDKMRAARQFIKLSLYRAFSCILLLNFFVCFAVVICEAELIRSNYFINPSSWQLLWFFIEGVWKTIFVISLGLIMYLWRPHENSLKYAYFKQLTVSDSDCEKEIDKSVFHLPIDGENLKNSTNSFSPKFTIGEVENFTGIGMTTDDDSFGI